MLVYILESGQGLLGGDLNHEITDEQDTAHITNRENVFPSLVGCHGDWWGW